MHITTWAFGKVAVGFGVAGAILWSGLLFIAMPDKYTSDAVLRLTTVGITTPSATDNTEEFVTSLIQDALARKSLSDIINQQGLYRRERAREPMEDVIDRMRHDVRFERIGHSKAFHVTFRYRDAEQARRTVRELVRKLIEATFLRALSRQSTELKEKPRFAYGLEVLDPANLPKRPSSPNRFLIAAEGLIGGLLLGAVTAVVARARATTNPAGNSSKSS